MGSWILLYLAIASAPAQLGTYTSEESCKDAIRIFFVQKMAPSAMNQAAVRDAVEVALKYQREYVCVKT